MKKTVKPFMLFAFIIFAITLVHGSGCSKKNDNEDCRTCKAFGIDGIEDEAEVCSESQESAFRSKNAGKEISCN